MKITPPPFSLALGCATGLCFFVPVWQAPSAEPESAAKKEPSASEVIRYTLRIAGADDPAAPTEPKARAKWYITKGESGDPSAFFKLGRGYLLDLGHTNAEEGRRLVFRAAADGYVPAQSALGEYCFRG